MGAKQSLANRRQNRVRFGLKRLSTMRMRLTVFRSSRHIYAQVIDDKVGVTLVSASSLKTSALSSDRRDKGIGVAEEVGKEIALKAKEAGILKVVFDRGSYLYHGRVKALAEAAREAGLSF